MAEIKSKRLKEVENLPDIVKSAYNGNQES